MTRLAVRLLSAASMCVALLATGGCGTTSPDVAGYRQQASLTVGTAVSELATTRLYLMQLQHGDVFHASVTTQIRYRDESLGSGAQSFGSLNPPVGARALYQRCNTLLGDAQDLVAEVRIAVHRDDTARYPRLVRELADLGKKLERLESRLPS